MTRAPEAVDKAVDAVRRAEHMLAGQAEEALAKTRKARRRLARKAKATRKDLAKTAKQAKANVQHLTGTEKKGRRKWPWILGLVLAAAGTAAVVRAKTSSSTNDAFTTPEPRTTSEDEQAPESKAQENGKPAPKPAAPQKK
ncbi:hypothetical protein [Actinocrispum sp. NPDC049592]|uniref:hypothetical protein n=1 Tax=Actinocrispum sp. NPDC049592 TaxID=3154835 RepID=UPI00342C8FDE